MASVGFFGSALSGLGGSAIGSAVVTLYLADQTYQAQLAKARSQTEVASTTMAQRVKALGPAFALAGAAAAVGIGAVAVKAFSESQLAIAQTNAVLKSTGGIAGVTAAEVTGLATRMQKLTTFSDEEVRSAENLLLTFTKISDDIFPETTRAVLDMSTALGQDLKSSSIQLGKALNDPIKGVVSLRRVGVDFNQTAVDTIKLLVDEGKLLEAQKFILAEVGKEFGGSAQAAAKTFAGQMAQLGNELNDVLEELGKFIVAVAQGLMPAIRALVPIMGLAARNAGLLLTAFAAFATVRWLLPFLTGLIVKIQALAGASLSAQIATSNWMASVAAAAGPLGILAVAIGGLIVYGLQATPMFERFSQKLQAAGLNAEQAATKIHEVREAMNESNASGRQLGGAMAVVARQSARASEQAEGWAMRQRAFAHSLEESDEAARRASRGVRRFANMSTSELKDFRESASASLNFVEASFEELIGASHRSANGILRAMRRALRSQQEFAENANTFLGRVRENLGPRMESSAEQMVAILAQSGREGADEMRALATASDREIRQMLGIFARGREGANRTATRITNIGTAVQRLPSGKTIDIRVNVTTSGSGNTFSDRNVADALARELAHGG